MAIEDVIAKIKETAEKKKQEILAEANEEKKRILAEWQNKADNFYAEERKRIETEAENEKRSIILAKRLELRKELLSAKQEIIDEAFDKAYEKIKSLPEKEYEKMLENLMKLNSEGGEEVIGNKKDVDLLKKVIKKVGKDLKISKETRDIEGGFILKNGKIETNVSLRTIFETEREELEQEVGKLLNVF